MSNTMWKHLTKEEKNRIKKTKQKMANREWVSNIAAQEVFDSEKTEKEVWDDFLENGFQ